MIVITEVTSLAQSPHRVRVLDTQARWSLPDPLKFNRCATAQEAAAGSGGVKWRFLLSV